MVQIPVEVHLSNAEKKLLTGWSRWPIDASDTDAFGDVPINFRAVTLEAVALSMLNKDGTFKTTRERLSAADKEFAHVLKSPTVKLLQKLNLISRSWLLNLHKYLLEVAKDPFNHLEVFPNVQ
jgi:hypothetical protein